MSKNVYSAEHMREIGKANFFHSQGDEEKRKYGLSMIIEAYKEKDPEATFLVARLVLDDVLHFPGGDQTEKALSLMCAAANQGCIQARAFINTYCEERYRESVTANIPTEASGDVLVDFDGKPIKINRKGIFTPVDAVLTSENGHHTLVLSTNVQFVYTDPIIDPKRFQQAVCDGLLAWQGDYEVFGGQKLSVRVEITHDDNIFDNLLIFPVTDYFGAKIKSISDVVATKEKKAQINNLLDNKRSFAVGGIKWSVNSRKFIYIQSENGRFDDYEEITQVAKHEFGHALGLGDLYTSSTDRLEGVEKGTYIELDSYAISSKYYNLVMCDHHGPISNNDIEMIVLAFRENKMQMYQPGRLKGRISDALGKGN